DIQGWEDLAWDQLKDRLGDTVKTAIAMANVRAFYNLQRDVRSEVTRLGALISKSLNPLIDDYNYELGILNEKLGKLSECSACPTRKSIRRQTGIDDSQLLVENYSANIEMDQSMAVLANDGPVDESMRRQTPIDDSQLLVENVSTDVEMDQSMVVPANDGPADDGTSTECGDQEPDPEDEEKDKEETIPKTSATPEDKFGPAGYDPPETAEGSEDRYIPAGQSLDYRIDFWNKPDAEVPTQDAIIIDHLDPAIFDVSTLEITRVGFLNWDLEISSGQVVDTRIDTMPEMEIAVEIKAGLGMEIPGFANNADIDENTLVFWFHTIDPETGEWPDDPFAGFLPPFNPETGFEIGWIEYTVDPVEGLASGTQLANVAYVEFDFGADHSDSESNIHDHPAPKVDPDVEPAVPAPWINTIDAAGPTSRVETLPSNTQNDVLTVRWNGQDDAGGSGIASYDIYVATDDGPFELWLDDTTDTEALFAASPGHTYAFYSRARDNVGYVEDAADVPDATVAVMPLIGDMDQNGEIGTDDTIALVLGLRDPEGYEQTYGSLPSVFGDTDGDGDLDFDDIPGFVELLRGNPLVVGPQAAGEAETAVQRIEAPKVDVPAFTSLPPQSASVGPWLAVELVRRPSRDHDASPQKNRTRAAEEASYRIFDRVLRSRDEAIQERRAALPRVHWAAQDSHDKPTAEELTAVWADDWDWLGRRPL
ncbi:MAG: hypothetical protein ACC655_09025, partial [Rhodothermia bacterium]